MRAENEITWGNAAGHSAFPCIAKTFHGLEEVLAEELKQLGAASVIPLRRAVSFTGSKTLLYQANLRLRTALRILKPLFSFRASDEKTLYDQILQYDWTALMSLRHTFAVDAVVYSDHFKHSGYVALKVKDAIADRFRQSSGRRPSVDALHPHIRLHIHIARNLVQVSLDSSGDALCKRGYRHSKAPAPLNEVLAAGLIMLSGWKGSMPLTDPMCGSGTIPIEAAMLACNMPPLMQRNAFCFMHWPDFEPGLWKTIRQQAEAGMTSPRLLIQGSDASAAAVQMARKSAQACGVNRLIRFEKADFESLRPHKPPGMLIINPPYGKRLKPESTNLLYRMIGNKLKRDFTGFEAWLLSSNRQALKHIGLRAAEKHRLYNGSLVCLYQKFELYSGSRKGQKSL